MDRSLLCELGEWAAVGYYEGAPLPRPLVWADGKWTATSLILDHNHNSVRVGGYSEYFANLNHELQDSIIARTEHGMG